VTVNNCHFTNNTAQYNAGSILAYTKSIVNVNGSSFSNGYAAVGGAMIAFTESNVTLRDVHMSSNTADDGGAISVQSVLYVYNSSFSNNKAQSRGGAIVGDAQSGILLYNTSFSDNTCQGMYILLLQSCAVL
jgi:autotransporter family porin